MIHYTECPVCKSGQIVPALTAKDHTVSGSNFAIWHCNHCSTRFTQDIPEQNEIGAYYASENYISHSDTKKGIVNSLYHIVRKRTLRSKLKLVESKVGKKKGSILDIGCGTGAFLHTMEQAGWQITGLEPDATARQKATELYGISPAAPDQLFQLQSGSFDAISMWHVLEHVHELQAYVKQLHNLLADDGRIFIAVPNYTSYDATVYAENWAAYDVPRHLYHFSPASMESLLQQYGLKLLECRPMWFDSFYVSMLSEQYKNGKPGLLKAGWQGLVSNLKTIGHPKNCSSVIYIAGKK